MWGDPAEAFASSSSLSASVSGEDRAKLADPASRPAANLNLGLSGCVTSEVVQEHRWPPRQENTHCLWRWRPWTLGRSDVWWRTRTRGRGLAASRRSRSLTQLLSIGQSRSKWSYLYGFFFFFLEFSRFLFQLVIGKVRVQKIGIQLSQIESVI